MAGLTLDTGALISYKRGEQRVRGFLERAYGRGVVPAIPTTVAVEAWRGGSRNARLAKLRSRCEIVGLDGRLAAAAGELLSRCDGAWCAPADPRPLTQPSRCFPAS